MRLGSYNYPWSVWLFKHNLQKQTTSWLTEKLTPSDNFMQQKQKIAANQVRLGNIVPLTFTPQLAATSLTPLRNLDSPVHTCSSKLRSLQPKHKQGLLGYLLSRNVETVNTFNSCSSQPIPLFFEHTHTHTHTQTHTQRGRSSTVAASWVQLRTEAAQVSSSCSESVQVVNWGLKMPDERLTLKHRCYCTSPTWLKCCLRSCTSFYFLLPWIGHEELL